MKVKVAAAQYPIEWHEDIESWKKYTHQWVEQAALDGAQLLVFPEYGAMELVSIFPKAIQSDLHVQIEQLQSVLMEFKATFEFLAKTFQIVIVAPSFPVKINTAFVNRAFVFGPRGEAGFQDKLFMTRFETEEWGIESISKKVKVFQADWGSFGIQICYDSEFSIGTHHLAQNGMEILVVPSCTETLRGATRVHVGTRARAMEQQVYAVVSQTIGDANWSPAVDVNYGYAAFYSTADKEMPEDGVLLQAPAQTKGWSIVELDLQLLQNVRSDGQVFNYKDHLKINQSFFDDTLDLEIVHI